MIFMRTFGMVALALVWIFGTAGLFVGGAQAENPWVMGAGFVSLVALLTTEIMLLGIAG